MDQQQNSLGASSHRYRFWLYTLTVTPLLMYISFPDNRVDLLDWVAIGVLLVAGLPWNLPLIIVGLPLLNLLKPAVSGYVMTTIPLVINAFLLWHRTRAGAMAGFHKVTPRQRLLLACALTLLVIIVVWGYGWQIREHGEYQTWVRAAAACALMGAFGLTYITCVGRIPRTGN